MGGEAGGSVVAFFLRRTTTFFFLSLPGDDSIAAESSSKSIVGSVGVLRAGRVEGLLGVANFLGDSFLRSLGVAVTFLVDTLGLGDRWGVGASLAVSSSSSWGSPKTWAMASWAVFVGDFFLTFLVVIVASIGEGPKGMCRQLRRADDCR